MVAYKHLDEARRTAIEALMDLLAPPSDLARAVLIDDLFGKLRVVLWPRQGADAKIAADAVDEAMRAAGQTFWSGDIWICDDSAGPADRMVYDTAWEEAAKLTETLRLDARHRTRTAWFVSFRPPPWSTRGHELGSDTGPPIVVFYSFKGGVGRTTALASFAIQRARSGERVAIVDFDLDAPGVGTLLAADENGTTAPWGVVDYLLERQHGPVPFDDYVHRCARPNVTGDGAISVIPAGRMDSNYLTKLSRVDLEVSAASVRHPLELLLEDIRSTLAPHWVLIDARAGLSPAAGLLLVGLAHLHVLLGTTNEQGLLGLEQIIHHLGAERLQHDMQADCVLVQAMVPDNQLVAQPAQELFRARMEQIFTEHYLVAHDADPEERFWSVRDIDNAEAPHVPVVIPYREKFAFFRSIDEIADELATAKAYQELDQRIRRRFPHLEEGDAED